MKTNKGFEPIIYIWRLLVKQPLISPQCIFGDVNEATPDSARPNYHPSSRTNISSIPATSEPSNLTPPPTVTESKGAEPPTGEEEEEEAMATMGKRNNTANSLLLLQRQNKTTTDASSSFFSQFLELRLIVSNFFIIFWCVAGCDFFLWLLDQNYDM